MKSNYYWNKAIKIISGGNGLLSKRPNRFLPDNWPTYFSKAKGINIWYQIHINFKIRISIFL